MRDGCRWIIDGRGETGGERMVELEGLFAVSPSRDHKLHQNLPQRP